MRWPRRVTNQNRYEKREPMLRARTVVKDCTNRDMVGTRHSNAVSPKITAVSGTEVGEGGPFDRS
jgi:hypothetical protein